MTLLGEGPPLDCFVVSDFVGCESLKRCCIDEIFGKFWFLGIYHFSPTI